MTQTKPALELELKRFQRRFCTLLPASAASWVTQEGYSSPAFWPIPFFVPGKLLETLHEEVERREPMSGRRVWRGGRPRAPEGPARQAKPDARGQGSEDQHQLRLLYQSSASIIIELEMWGFLFLKHLAAEY